MKIGARVVGINMRHFLPYTALALFFSVLPANAADRYGGWLLEQPGSFVLTLSFKQSVPLNNQIATSELGFICDQRDKAKIVGVVLIPFDGTFENKQDVIPVLIQESSDRHDPFDLLQKWKNRTEYIFLESQDDVIELASFLKERENDGVKSVHFLFPNNPEVGPQTSNHVAINVSGFSSGFDAFQMTCALPQ